jgi:hypothetical protein
MFNEKPIYYLKLFGAVVSICVVFIGALVLFKLLKLNPKNAFLSANLVICYIFFNITYCLNLLKNGFKKNFSKCLIFLIAAVFLYAIIYGFFWLKLNRMSNILIMTLVSSMAIIIFFITYYICKIIEKAIVVVKNSNKHKLL